MIKNTLGIVSTLVVVIILLVVLVPSFTAQYSLLGQRQQQASKVPYVDNSNSPSIPDTLEYVSGDDVLGMVPYALEGQFILVLDGIQIKEDSDLDGVNLSGVVGANYTLQTVTSGKLPILMADVRR